jgi:CRP/FNR family transcriptional regulator, cyclic AMP receptor protein
MNRKSTDVDHLAHVPIFAGLSDKERHMIRGLLTEVTVEPGKVLARQGSIGHEFFIIVSGSASVDRDGEHLADVGPGDFQGEISLLDAGPRTATVTASTPLTMLVASHQEFNALLDRTPEIARQMLPAIAHRVRSLSHDSHTH